MKYSEKSVVRITITGFTDERLGLRRFNDISAFHGALSNAKISIAPCRHMPTAIRRTIEIMDEIDEVIEL